MSGSESPHVIGVHHFAGPQLHLAGVPLSSDLLRQSLDAGAYLEGAGRDLDREVRLTGAWPLTMFRVGSSDVQHPLTRARARRLRRWQKRSGDSDVPDHPLVSAELLAPFRREELTGRFIVSRERLAWDHGEGGRNLLELGRVEQHHLLACLLDGREREAALQDFAEEAPHGLLDLLEGHSLVVRGPKRALDVPGRDPSTELLARLLGHQDGRVRHRALLLCEQLRRPAPQPSSLPSPSP